MAFVGRQTQAVWIGLRAVRLMAVLVAVVAIGMGCSRGDGVLRWSEDVTLVDGRVVTLHREQWFDGGTAEDGSGLRGRMIIRFAHPDTGRAIIWDSPYGFTTQALFVDSGAVFLLVRAGLGGVQEAAGCPNPLSLLFEYRTDRWEQVALNASPMKRIAGNMTRDPKAQIVSIKGANYKLDAAATMAGASGMRMGDSSIDLTNVGEQTFRCPGKRKTLTR
jgi:hypothetical protein